MASGRPFEVSKEVFDRAKAQYKGKEDNAGGYYYMAPEDRYKLFSDAILYGYGLYSCLVHEEDGKYICTWERGDSCD